MFVYIIAGVLILWGLYGIIKKKMIAPWAFTMKGKYEMDAARNTSPIAPFKLQNYFIYGTWAVLEGIFLIIVGIIVLIANP